MNHCCMTLSVPLGRPEEAVYLVEQEREQAVYAVEIGCEECDGDYRDDGRVPDLKGLGPSRAPQLRAHVAHELPCAREEVVARALRQAALATRRAPLFALAVPRHARGTARRRPRQIARLVMTRSHLFVLSIRQRPYFLPTLRAGRTGVPGLEPGLSVLETDVLTTDTIPLRERMKAEVGRMKERPVAFPSSFRLHPSYFV